MQLKYPLPNQDISCIVFKFNCLCDKSYVGQTSRHFKTRIKEHPPACVLEFIEKEPEIMATASKNAAKRSSVAEHLVNNRDCAKKYDLSRYKISHHCNNVFDLIKSKAISIYLEKPVLCKQKEFDYKVSLFS